MTAGAILVVLATSALGVGLLIGTVGIGGLLITPVLIYVVGLPVHQAMATALCSFVATNLFGALAYYRHGSIDWAITLPLAGGAVLFGFIGAVVNAVTASGVLSILLGAVVMFAGVYVLVGSRRRRISPFQDRPLRRAVLLVSIGAFAGFGSVLVGAGGPILLVPVMLATGFAPLPTIGAGQVLGVLAAGSGTVGNLTYGSIDFKVAATIATFQVVGVLLGARIAHAINAATVRWMAAWLCVLVGIAMLVI
ncbi:MAG: sulfite exporter TauE/SafE family protein [Gammaproteobacteria bacterium]